MIEGYSVDEAASVLGVPKGRVWELLARGILAGTPEDGGGMRVYLQGRPMEPIVGRPPEGRPVEPGERNGPNGNGGDHGQPGFEASPFRELLTEFRNLTERYGQALLALGESRGEVASLRTRVELLETRVDLRLGSAPPLMQWSPPSQAPEAAERPQAEFEPEPMSSKVAEDADAAQSVAALEPESEEIQPALTETAMGEPAKTSRSRRRRKARSATEGFAEALARAQDPTAAELPGGREAQAAFNELRERIRRESTVGESVPAAGSLEDEPAETMGFGEVSAPATEVELDSFLADEELGGGVEQTAAAEIGAFEGAATSEQPEPMGESEPIQIADDQRAAEAVETDAAIVDFEAIEPVAAVDAADAIEQVDAVDAIESVGAIADMKGIEPVNQPVEAFPAASEVDSEAAAAIADEPSMPAEPKPVEEAKAEAPAYSHEWDEPDWIAEEDVDWGTDESAASPEPVAMGESAEIGWDELPAATAPVSLGPSAEAEMDEVPAANAPISVEPSPMAGMDEEPAEDATATEPAISESESSPAAEDEPASISSPTPPTSQPISVDAIGPSAVPSPAPPSGESSPGGPSPATPTSAQAPEEELMWLGDEFRAGPATWGSSGRSTTIPKPVASLAMPDLGVSPAEDEALSRMAVERGWDDEELRAIRSLLAQPGRVALDEPDLGEAASAPSAPAADVATEAARHRTVPAATSDEEEAREEDAFDWEQGPPAWNPPPVSRASIELPGAVELDQAMAAFEVGPWSKESAERQREAAPSPPVVQQNASAERQEDVPPSASSSEPTSKATAPPSDETSAPAETETDWLRGRRGPAASAYRRLRRLFP